MRENFVSPGFSMESMPESWLLSLEESLLSLFLFDSLVANAAGGLMSGMFAPKSNEINHSIALFFLV